MTTVELQAAFGKKVHEHIIIANLHMKEYYRTGNNDSYKAGMDRMSKAFEDIEMAFTLKLLTIEEAIEWQQKVSYEVSKIC